VVLRAFLPDPGVRTLGKILRDKVRERGVVLVAAQIFAPGADLLAAGSFHVHAFSVRAAESAVLQPAAVVLDRHVRRQERRAIEEADPAIAGAVAGHGHLQPSVGAFVEPGGLVAHAGHDGVDVLMGDAAELAGGDHRVVGEQHHRVTPVVALPAALLGIRCAVSTQTRTKQIDIAEVTLLLELVDRPAHGVVDVIGILVHVSEQRVDMRIGDRRIAVLAPNERKAPGGLVTGHEARVAAQINLEVGWIHRGVGGIGLDVVVQVRRVFRPAIRAASAA